MQLKYEIEILYFKLSFNFIEIKLKEEKKRILQLAVVPPICLDSKQRRYKYINNNGYVNDPAALFKANKNETFWNEKEKEIFLEKLLAYGKNFEIIATFLEKKV
jgi:hypothetical protein